MSSLPPSPARRGVWGTSQPPDPGLGTPEPDFHLLCAMPVSLPFTSFSSGWSGEFFFLGGVQCFNPPSPFFLETCFNRESMQCALFCYTPTPPPPIIHCNWGIRDWTLGGSHTFPIRGGRERDYTFVPTNEALDTLTFSELHEVN